MLMQSVIISMPELMEVEITRYHLLKESNYTLRVMLRM